LVAAADRAALKEYAIERERIRRAKLAARERPIWTITAAIPAGGDIDRT
jgi:hypothetical protein